ncbi:hypothetical protein RUND412_010039 [Rhizina undulata]
MYGSLRIAILEAGYSEPAYGDLLSDLLKSAAEELSEEGMHKEKLALDIKVFDAWSMEEYPQLEDVDAVLISGSRSNAFDNTPWILKLMEFVQTILNTQSRVRLIGVCFGHQIIGRALGAKVVRNPYGWEGQVVKVTLLEKGTEIFGKDSLKIPQSHRDWVTTVPANVFNIGTSELCSIQGFYAANRLFSTQGHPERKFVEAHDGILIGKAFLRFLLEV